MSQVSIYRGEENKQILDAGYLMLDEIKKIFSQYPASLRLINK